MLHLFDFSATSFALWYGNRRVPVPDHAYPYKKPALGYVPNTGFVTVIYRNTFFKCQRKAAMTSK